MLDDLLRRPDVPSDVAAAVAAELARLRQELARGDSGSADGTDADPTQPDPRLGWLYDGAPVAMLVIEDGTVDDANRQAEVLTGYPRDDLVGKALRLLHGTDEECERVWGDLRARAWSGALAAATARIVHADGTARDVRIHASRRASSTPSGAMVAVLHDITEAQSTLEQLESETGLLRTVLDHTPVEVFVKDRQSRFVYWNHRTAMREGERVELAGKTDFDIIPHLPELAWQHFDEEQRIMETGEGFVDREINIDQVTYLSTKVPLRDARGQATGIVGINYYVTQFRQAQRAAEESRRRYQSLVDVLPVGIFVHRDGTLLYANPAGLRIFGASEGMGVVGLRIADRIHPDDLERVTDRIRQIASEGVSPELTDVRFLRLDGGVVPAVTTGIPFEWEGEPAVLSTVLDTSERTRAEQALRRAEEEQWLANQRRTLHFERTPLAVIEWDPAMRVVDWNPAAEAIFGHTREEALGQPVALLLPEAARPQADSVWAALLGASGGERATLACVGRDGQALVCDWYSTPLVDEGGVVTGVSSLVLDITRQRVAEENQRKLRDGMERAQRLESLGVLAGGIAHDFNNILSPILGFTELLMAGALEGSTERDWLRQVNAAALRARDLVAQILTFSRKEESSRQQARLQPVIQETLRLIRASLPATIEVHQEVDATCGAVAVDPSQFHQVVMNLCTNAGYAMGDGGGSLTVAFGETDVDERLAARLGCQGAGRYARLTVADTGCGMDAETLERVFEPFFTTKPRGEGTGLGLSTVHGIVQSFGGGISAYSEVGRGTTFSVFLPLADVVRERVSLGAPELSPGSEQVLVVDDEPALAAMASEMLRTLGYRVTAYTDSREALRAYRDDPQAFDLVVTDQTMPHLTGSQLAASARFLRPELPVLIITGYGADPGGVCPPSDAPVVLTKPYSLRDLSDAVRALLDGARPDAG